MPQSIIDLLNQGAQANRKDTFRHGNLIHLPAEGDLVITGDLHGHRRNFERAVTFADLAHHPKRHIILQEIIHGGPTDCEGGCLSYQLLFDVVRYKLKFPEQVHVILSNHDTAFINNSEVMKDGKEMNRAMRAAIKQEYKKDSTEIISAINQYLFSQPLAVKCQNRIWISHSLPADRLADKFDPKIMDRELQADDIVKPGSAYLLIWGRKMSQALVDRMAELFDVDIFILGHQPQEQGWRQVGNNLIIIASNHNHGCLLPIDLATSYTVEQLIEAMVPMASLV
jgi:hypothetical protein